MSVMDIHQIAVYAIMGPAPCRACGEDVLYIRQGTHRGWLHHDGRLTCRLRPVMDRRAYNREWMRRRRGAA